jgi:hypothetical protein
MEKINKKWRRSINATHTRPSNIRPRHGAQKDTKQKQDASELRFGYITNHFVNQTLNNIALTRQYGN